MQCVPSRTAVPGEFHLDEFASSKHIPDDGIERNQVARPGAEGHDALPIGTELSRDLVQEGRLVVAGFEVPKNGAGVFGFVLDHPSRTPPGTAERMAAVGAESDDED